MSPASGNARPRPQVQATAARPPEPPQERPTEEDLLSRQYYLTPEQERRGKLCVAKTNAEGVVVMIDFRPAARALHREHVPPTGPRIIIRARPRGAGRPRGRRVSRSSSRSGDSGDSDPSEPEPPGLTRPGALS